MWRFSLTIQDGNRLPPPPLYRYGGFGLRFFGLLPSSSKSSVIPTGPTAMRAYKIAYAAWMRPGLNPIDILLIEQNGSRRGTECYTVRYQWMTAAFRLTFYFGFDEDTNSVDIIELNSLSYSRRIICTVLLISRSTNLPLQIKLVRLDWVEGKRCVISCLWLQLRDCVFSSRRFHHLL